MCSNSSSPDPGDRAGELALARERQNGSDIARGFLVNALGILASCLGFVFYLLLGRWFGATTAGAYLLVWAAVDLASKVGIAGLDRGLLAKVPPSHAVGDQAGVYSLLRHSLLLGAVSSAVIFLALESLAQPLCSSLLERPDLVAPLRLMAFGLPLWTISAIFLHTTRAFRIMRHEVLARRVLEPMTLLALLGPVYLLDLGTMGLAAAFVASTAVGLSASAWFLNRVLPLRGVPGPVRWAELRAMGAFSAPIGLYDLLNQLLQRMDLFFVGRFFPGASAGIYGVSQETAFAFKKVRQAFDPILLPVFSVAQNVGNRAGLRFQFQNVSRWVLIFSLATLGPVLLAGQVILGLFGDEFTGGAGALAVLTLAVGINSSMGVAELLFLVDRPHLNLLNSLVAVICAALLNLWLVPQAGMLGASLAVLAAFTLMNLLRILEAWHLYGIGPDLPGSALVLLAASLAFLLGTMVRTLWENDQGLVQVASAVVYLITFVAACLGIDRRRKMVVNAEFLETLTGR